MRIRCRDLAAIHLELGFAGTSCADAAAKPGHLNAASREPRQQIVQLREFDLQLTFTGTGAPGEDIENDLRPVDHLALENPLEIPLLGRGEIAIDDDNSIDAAFTCAASSSTFPEPISVAATGVSRDCSTRSTTWAPALSARTSSSSIDSSAEVVNSVWAAPASTRGP